MGATDAREKMPGTTAERYAAAACGLLLAWWNLYHDEGFLFLGNLDAQIASCVACYGGSLVAAAALAVLRRKTPALRPVFFGLLAAQAVCGLGFYGAVAFGGDGLIVGLQVLLGTVAFAAIFLMLPQLDGCGFPCLPRLIALALALYAVVECAAWGAALACPGIAVRFATHIVLWAATALCAWTAFSRAGWQLEAAPDAPPADARPARRRLPWQIVLSAGAYWLVFGMTHALASGVVPVGHDKLIVCYLGSLAAAGLFFVVFGKLQPGDKIWPKMRLCIFPLAMLSFLLLAFANSGLTFVSIGFAQCAMDTYLAFYGLAIFVIARKMHGSVLQTAAAGALIATPFVIAGVIAGDSLKVLAELTPQLYNGLSVLAFLLLVAGTFWVGDDRQASLAWGLEKKLSPKRFEDSAIAERCAKAAARFGLTKREAEILVLLAHGQNAPAIAESEVISVNTVRTHIARIHRKMGVSNQRELDRRLAEEQ